MFRKINTFALFSFLILAASSAFAEVRFIASTGVYGDSASDPSTLPERFLIVNADGTATYYHGRVTQRASGWGNPFSFVTHNANGYSYGGGEWVSFNYNSGNPYGSQPFTLPPTPPVAYDALGYGVYSLLFYMPTTTSTSAARLLVMGSDEVSKVTLGSVSSPTGGFGNPMAQLINSPSGSTAYSPCRSDIGGCTWATRIDNDVFSVPAGVVKAGYNRINIYVKKKASTGGYGVTFVLEVRDVTTTEACPTGNYCGQESDNDGFINMSFAPR